MLRAVQASHYTENAPLRLKGDLFRGLVHDPYEAGVAQYSDISEGGLWARGDKRIITPHMAPITWGNPLTGRMFLGEMPLNRLRHYGMEVQVPHYRHVVDGLVYSDKHGLYLPSYIVA
jgi:hypothetical protein